MSGLAWIFVSTLVVNNFTLVMFLGLCSFFGVTAKVETVAARLYGAREVTWDGKARRRLARIEADGYGALPVCIAKTQYSFSTDATLRGAPSGHELHVREVRLAAGAGFVVMVCGDVMTMPGLPKRPASDHIDLSDDGVILGLS